MNEMPAIPDDLQHDYNMAKDASDHYPTWRGEEVIAFIERIGRAERALRDAETRTQQMVDAARRYRDWQTMDTDDFQRKHPGWMMPQVSDALEAALARPSQSPEEGQ
jgi:hypothetical protein